MNRPLIAAHRAFDRTAAVYRAAGSEKALERK